MTGKVIPFRPNGDPGPEPTRMRPLAAYEAQELSEDVTAGMVEAMEQMQTALERFKVLKARHWRIRGAA